MAYEIHYQRFNIKIENDGMEDDIPFQSGVFLSSMLIFRGVIPTSLGISSPI